LDEQAATQSSYYMIVFASGGTSYGVAEETLACYQLVILTIHQKGGFRWRSIFAVAAS
jgi:uncharacterized ion transporter superfamily protein YfcC